MTVDELEAYNEADVREEFAAPFIKLLGYEKGSGNDVLREQNLRYPHAFLGHKAPGRDPALRGRADYILSVRGIARWILETKAPDTSISDDHVEQAITYARHPEVSAVYVAVMNGREFRLYSAQKSADEGPRLVLSSCDPISLHENLEGTLSPESIRRDWSPRRIDTNRPLAKGYYASEEIVGGTLHYSGCEWDCDPVLYPRIKESMDESAKLIRSCNLSISDGRVWRNETGRIIANIRWAYPHKKMHDIPIFEQINDVNYVCLSQDISLDSEEPTAFDGFGEYFISQGDLIFDLKKLENIDSPIPMSIEVRSSATGFMRGRSFLGDFQSEQILLFTVSGLEQPIYMQSHGQFEIKIR